MLKSLTIAEAQQQLPTLPNALLKEPVIITQQNKPVMVAIDYDQFTSLIETLDILSNSEFAQQLQASIVQAEAGETIGWEEAKARLSQ